MVQTTRAIPFRILSVNARGVADPLKRRALFNHHRCNADILILQETHSSEKTEEIWTNEWGGTAYYSHGTTAARGIAVFVVRNPQFKILNVDRDKDGRTIIFDIEENDQYITIAAVYAPNQDRPEYFSTIEKKLETRHENKIIIGDFNLTLDVEKDRKNTYYNNNKATEVVTDMMDQYNLRDIWRQQNSDKREYSWFKRGEIQKASRIDLALVSAGADQLVEMVQYISSIKTDHRALYMVLNSLKFERGVGFWKFNNSYLRDPIFVKQMNNELENTKILCHHKNPADTWETIKTRIGKIAWKYAKEKVSEDKLIIAQLSERVNEYESRFLLNKEEDNLLLETKSELEEKLLEKAKSTMFRSKAKWYEEGERNTKYFFSLEKG